MGPRAGFKLLVGRFENVQDKLTSPKDPLIAFDAQSLPAKLPQGLPSPHRSDEAAACQIGPPSVIDPFGNEGGIARPCLLLFFTEKAKDIGRVLPPELHTAHRCTMGAPPVVS